MMTYRAFLRWTVLLLLPLFLQCAAGADGLLDAGIAAYRDGRYLEAEKHFQQIHKQHPENSNATYYFAMTQAQLGRFKRAKALYEEVVTLDPNSEAARLAQEGLLYLPEPSTLDRPPRFQADQKKSTAASEKPAQARQDNPPSTGTQAGLSPQDLMALQMMMGQMGGNQGGLNPWAYLMMPQATGNPANPTGMPSIDPSVMSNMLMNQMMQNFSLDGGHRDNQ